ncbi:MAG: bifunctional biotin--[acetyl-CoA-carboxylase] ligase/biotin operon repressor BirA [Candidatus Thiodiazotropha sp.]|jgi:BirA family transcriptional regulator, biotin operon repressor / biotin---[acetyl-CoA-carboxylase] ligase
MRDNFDLIKLMADGLFHSGRELGLILGISRAAVWKRIVGLRSVYGLEINAVKGRGYQLRESLDLLDRSNILEKLEVLGMQKLPNIELHTTLESTNSWLMQQGAVGIPSGSVCMAEHQVNGKGRHGRRWISPFARNLYFSLLLRFEMSPVQVAGLSLASAVGVLRMLHQINCVEAHLKWPNDILWRGKKLAGLLLEVSGEAGGFSQVVVGVGLNTRLGEQGEAIDQPWVDLDAIPNLLPYTRNELAALLIFHLNSVAEKYRIAGLSAFIDEWHEYDRFIGEEVVIRSASQEHRGKHLGIDSSGGIRIRIDGEPRSFYAGEVSLRRAK